MTMTTLIMTILWLACAFLYGMSIVIDKYNAHLAKKAKRGEMIVLDGKRYILCLIVDDGGKND